MRITAVIPVFNRQQLGMRAVRSALAQKHPLIEVIAVDDGSVEPFTPDHDVADDPRLRVIRLAQNSGAAAARNAGVAAARGDWIAYLDSDDVWAPDKLAQQAAFVAADPLLASNPLTLYATGFRQINMRSGHTQDRIPISTSQARELASGCWYSPGSTALMAKSTFETIGQIDTRFRRLEDLDWSMRLGLAGGRVAVAPFVGATVEVGARASFKTLQATCEQFCAKWSRHSDIDLVPGMKRRLFAFLDVERAASCHHENRNVMAAFYFARSLLGAPRSTLQLQRWWQ